MALDFATTFGSGKLIDKDGDCGLKVDEVENIGLYFSAHWCPPCRGFTPVLAEYYNKVNKDKKRFEVIFISSDQTDDQFKEYFSEMPWLALKYEERETKTKLSGDYGISGIPTLVILDKSGKVVTKDGRGSVNKNKDSGVLKWS